MKMRAVYTSVVVALALSFLVTGAKADVVSYYGVDENVRSLVSGSNASVAASGWATAVGESTLIDFEGVANTRNPNNLTVAPGAQLTVTGNACCGIVNTSANGTGFNITLGGSKYLLMGGAGVDSARAVFSFADSINAFSAFLTDTQTLYGGDISIEFDDGTSVSLSVPKNTSRSSSGFLFVGFTDLGKSFRSVTIATSVGNDYFGIDDVRFAMVSDPSADMPEPGSAALVAAALFGLALTRRRT
jgi:MYXO-CTERM domain-containing protein